MENNNFEEELQVFEIETEEGTTQKVAIIGAFDIEDHGSYVATLSMNAEDEFDDDSVVYFFRSHETGEDEFELSELESDDEFDLVSEVFDSIMEADDEEEEEAE